MSAAMLRAWASIQAKTGKARRVRSWTVWEALDFGDGQMCSMLVSYCLSLHNARKFFSYQDCTHQTTSDGDASQRPGGAWKEMQATIYLEKIGTKWMELRGEQEVARSTISTPFQPDMLSSDDLDPKHLRL
ncbi:hypothetical protein MRB53_039813 [Persea americana]|nr:hypothetical protein MRB53_039813 [Persea americana]